MKPGQLKPFFSFEERKVVLREGIWCIPSYYEAYSDYSFEGFESPRYFKQVQPVVVEFCSGNGDWILQKARENPQFNFVAVEKQFKRVKKIWSKRENQAIDNLLIVCSDARIVVREYFQADSLHSCYINFPDPWPKKRHQKHRLIQKSFVNELGRCLQPQGSLILATDDQAYLMQSLETLLQSPCFTPSFPPPYYQKNPLNYGYSYFENLWKAMGREIYLLQVEKKQEL